jgi:hypothetical protein
MRFTQSLFATAALVAAVFADVKITGAPMEFKAGETYEITYSGDKGDVPTTLLLRKGPSTNLQTVKTITDSATGGSFSWTVDPDFVDATDYALEIQQGEDDTNYWGPIALSGGTGEEVSSSTSAPSTSSPTSAATTEAPSETSAPSGSPTPSSNGTSTVTPTRGTPNPSDPTGAPEETGAASMLASSPLAFVFGAVAAMIYLN